MALIVQKYGGSSVGSLDRIQQVANKIIQTKKAGHDVLVVVSAMQGETDRLIQLAHSITPDPLPREYDMLVATGEQIAMSLLAIALNAQQIPAHSYTAAQIGIITTATHMKARILRINTDIIQKDLSAGFIVIVAGFQGISEAGHITTLGRGGSDTTAVALAAALQAEECQIYTDVPGVHLADPRIIPHARLLSEIPMNDMLELASAGAKVLQSHSVELASQHQVPLRVLSTFEDKPGTKISHSDKSIQKAILSGMALSRQESLILIQGLPKQPFIAGELLNKLKDMPIELDMITQHITAENTLDFRFALQRHFYPMVYTSLQDYVTKQGGIIIQSHPDVARLSLVGTGLRSHGYVMSKLCQVLGDNKIIPHMMTASEIKISVVIDENSLECGARALYEAFQQDF